MDRNSTPEELSYLRGKRYEAEKKPKGGNRGNQHTPKGQNVPLPSTAEALAEEHGVDAKTIKRDAAFARAVDTVADAGKNGVTQWYAVACGSGCGIGQAGG